jgi:hypothetical protein
MGPAAFGVTRRSTMGHVASVPDGQIAGLPIGVRVQPSSQKFFRSLLTQITCICFAVPSHRGAVRDRHGRGAGCGGRGMSKDE